MKYLVFDNNGNLIFNQQGAFTFFEETTPAPIVTPTLTVTGTDANSTTYPFTNVSSPLNINGFVASDTVPYGLGITINNYNNQQLIIDAQSIGNDIHILGPVPFQSLGNGNVQLILNSAQLSSFPVSIAFWSGQFPVPGQGNISINITLTIN